MLRLEFNSLLLVDLEAGHVSSFNQPLVVKSKDMTWTTVIVTFVEMRRVFSVSPVHQQRRKCGFNNFCKIWPGLFQILQQCWIINCVFRDVYHLILVSVCSHVCFNFEFIVYRTLHWSDYLCLCNFATNTAFATQAFWINCYLFQQFSVLWLI